MVKLTDCAERYENLKMITEAYLIQVIGRLNCNNTKKTIRWLKERGKEYQFVNLDERSLSPRELDSIFQHFSPRDCIDTESRYYRKRGLEYMQYDEREELSEHNELFRTPVLRCGGRTALGFDETFLRENT